MEPTSIALLGLAVMLALIALGMPIGFAMLLAGFVGNAYLLSFDAATHLLATSIWEQFSSYGLSVIPMFVLMGQLAFRSGVTERLYNAAYKWVGHWPGGLAATTIAASAGFSAICGSNSATAATMGVVALPEMKRYGYDRALTAGSVAIGGTLGVIVPPSVVLLLIAIQTEQSVLRLFLSSIVPSLLLTILLILTVLVLCARRRELGPAGPVCTWRDRLRGLSGVFETMLLFATVIGGLYLGIFTPTEAGAAGAFGALAVGVLRRRLPRAAIAAALRETLQISAMVILLVTSAVLFGRFMTVSRLPFELADWASSLQVDRLIVMLVVVAIYLVGGAVMDALGFLVVTIPIFFPLILALGYDPVWTAVILTIITSLGAVTPPVGVNVFIVKGLMPDVPIRTIFAGCAYFALPYALCIVAIWATPELVLYLPRVLVAGS
jgi:tripartite ATP-independent transporter DctM subunit